MNTRNEINQRLAIGALAGVLGLSACGGAPPSNSGEAIGETSAALTAPKPSAHGLVRDGAGAPIAHARVDVRAAGASRILDCTTTAADGTFTLDVRAGTYDLTVTPKSGFASQTFPGQAIARGTQLELIVAVFRTTNLAGHVVDQHGQPLSALVCGLGCAQSDASGAFAVTTRPGDLLSIRATIPGGGFLNLAQPIGPAQGSSLTIVIPVFKLTGTILDPAGAPVAGTTVAAPPCTNVDTGGLTGSYCPDAVQTDSSGRFQMLALPGNVALEVNGTRGAFVTEAIAADTDVTIRLAPLQSLSGQVLDRNGNGIGGQEVCLTHVGCAAKFCSQSCTATAGDGRYQLSAASGTFTLQITALPSTSTIGLVTLSKTITLSGAAVQNVAFPTRTLTGTVLDSDGSPAPGATVFAECFDMSFDGFTGEDCPGGQVADQSGRFQFSIAAPGDVTLDARSNITPNPPTGSTQVSLSDDADVVVQLTPERSISGQLLAANGSGDAGVQVCFSSTVDGGCTTTAADGTYQMTLPPGTYDESVTESSPDIEFSSIGQSVTVPSSAPTLREAATRVVPLQVLNADGSPLAGVEVFADCASVPAGNATEGICPNAQITDGSGRASIAAPAGVSLALQVHVAPELDGRTVSIEQLSVGDGTELTIAVQQSTSP